MTQTTTPADRDAAAIPTIPLQPADILMSLLVTLLAPMFLSLAGGNITYARMAAFETVNAYRVRNHADLIAIAQIIGFGLAALDSLSRSMADNLSLSMTLRLRGNATTLNRAAEQSRRAHQASLASDSAPAPAAPDLPESHRDAPEVAANLAAAQQAVTAPLASRNAGSQRPAAIEAPALTAAAATPLAVETRHQAVWAIAMVKEADKITASIPNLPPSERNAASIRVAALSSTANQLLAGMNAPPHDESEQPATI